ncbi:MAG: hypothetical protein KIB42_01000 [Varibaculum cambriense]|uniref:hypothetical protein n=1 Tax=Varibaculum cambriense TaxID=184870 RepID=UPI001ED2F6A1|nr:hypothetical protein [Varibaculum cambriense]MBS5918192.1 hypothetical protein [Varibaculum cambriense]
MKTSFRSRVRDYRLKREKDQPLDQAVYMTIATGRLEPLLRALAIYPVYSSGELRSQADSQFLVAYATRLRSPASPTVNAALLTEHLDSIREGTEESQPIGALLNPGGQFEITLEAHDLPRLASLVAGIPTEDALTPIASESLDITPANSAHTALLVALTPSLPVPTGLTLQALTASFQGFKPGSWPVVFLVDSGGVPQAIPATLKEQLTRKLPQAILVDPAVPDWRRDLFWGYRELLT